MLRQQIKKWFEEAVRLDFTTDPELKRVLLQGHPKIDGFVDRMTEQFIQAEKVCRQKKVFLKQKTIQDTVYDMTKFFMKGLEGEAKRRHESDLQRVAREAEANKIQEFEDVLSGNLKDEWLEAGVITNEKIDKEREVASQS